MIKKIALYAVGVVACASVISCNESSTSQNEVTYGSTLVSAFSLKSNSKVLHNLDSVFFSIDLADGRIFNADSLPYGTDVSRLQLNISTDACSTVELYVPRPNQSDSIINYLKNSTDSVDFTNGAVRLHVVSFDTKAFRDYMINVNVHRIKPDSLVWDRMAMRELPTTLPSPAAQKTVRMGDEAVCLAESSGRYTLAFSDDPGAGTWKIAEMTFPFRPDVNSFAAAGDRICLLADDGRLFVSDDRGESWNDTGRKWSHIYGAYNSTLLGVEKAGGAYYHVTWPESGRTPVPAECPVGATGSLASVGSDWSVSTQVIMAGGRLADGSLSSAVYGYDGRSWAKMSDKYPVKTAGVALFNYRVSDVDSVSWRVRERHVLLAVGGAVADGVNRKVYISRDFGVNWKEGDQLLQLPDYVPAMTSAQPLVFDTRYPLSRSAGDWREYPSVRLSPWMKPAEAPASRATTPVTQWEVPYVYLFGGYDASGRLFNTVWRGVINRLTFKPLQ